MNVTMLPNDFVRSNNKFVRLEDNVLSDDFGERLNSFYMDNLDNSRELSLGYAPAGFVLVRCFNKVDWNKNLHNLLCKEFDLVLYAVDCTTGYSPSGCEVEVNWIYIVKPSDEYVSLVSIGFDEVKF